MRIAISDELTIGDVGMRTLDVASLLRALGAPDREEKIPLHGGGVRIREIWTAAGVSTLRDEETEAVTLSVDPSLTTISVNGAALPNTEAAFLKMFPTAEKNLGHAFILHIDRWRVDVGFARNTKCRGVGSTAHCLARVWIAPRRI